MVKPFGAQMCYKTFWAPRLTVYVAKYLCLCKKKIYTECPAKKKEAIKKTVVA